jgi:uncharacterized protein (TIGR02284 family)
MTTQEATIEVLNDLVGVNNDRIAGYEHALKELNGADIDLIPVFSKFIDESRTLKMDLATEVSVLKGDTETGTSISGKIYRAWMDVKASFTGHDRHAVLENCEFGEDAAQKAYKTALESEHITGFLREMIERQKAVLKSAHNQIKALRDLAALHT